MIEDRVALERLSPDSLSHLTEATERAAGQLTELEQPWLAAIRAELRTAVFAATWRDQKKAWQEGIEELAAWQRRLLGHSVVLPGDGMPPTELIEQLQQLRDRLAAGKGVSKTFQKDLHRVREACTVDDEPLRRVEDAELCIAEARSRRRSSELIRGWNNAVGRIYGPLIDPQPPPGISTPPVHGRRQRRLRLGGRRLARPARPTQDLRRPSSGTGHVRHSGRPGRDAQDSCAAR